jgi:lipopolysaccharide transport system ATP-binding protein
VRLAFAVAAHLEPEILLVDEVLAVGDAEFQKKCLGKMGEVAQGGRTVLFVSHNLGAVRSLCNRGILLENGQAAYFSNIEDCVNEYLGAEHKNDLPQINLPVLSNSPIHLTFVQVVNKNNIVAKQFSYDEEIRIIFGVKVNSRQSRIYSALHIHDSEQQTLLFSRDFEADIERLSKNWLPGNYRYSIAIPKCTLIPGIYRLSIHIASSLPAKVLNGVDAVCPFEIVDKGSVRAQTGFPWVGKMGFFPEWILHEIQE